jgi:hypothetical protein
LDLRPKDHFSQNYQQPSFCNTQENHLRIKRKKNTQGKHSRKTLKKNTQQTNMMCASNQNYKSLTMEISHVELVYVTDSLPAIIEPDYDETESSSNNVIKRKINSMSSQQTRTMPLVKRRPRCAHTKMPSSPSSILPLGRPLAAAPNLSSRLPLGRPLTAAPSLPMRLAADRAIPMLSVQ